MSALKKAATTVWQNGGIIKSIENMGQRPLPYKMYKHGAFHKEGRYFIVNFDSPAGHIVGIKHMLQRDVDIIRPKILRKEVETHRPCEEGPCDFGEMNEEMRKRLHIQLRDLVKKV